MKGKKAFLFTFITIFLLFALVILTYDYMQRNKQTQEFLAGLSHSNRLNYMRENVVSDFFTFLDIDFNGIERNDTHIIINFNNFSIFKEEKRYVGLLKMQEEFLEGLFSNLSNTRIQLENYVPEFFLYPYNTTFVVDNGNKPQRMFIYIEDFNRFNGMGIDFKLNTSIDDVNKTFIPFNDSLSDPYFRVRVFDKDGVIIMDEFKSLNSTKENDEFFISFNKVVQTFPLPTFSINVLQNVTFSYGRYRDINPFGFDTVTDATFHLEATGLEVDVQIIHLNYTRSEKKAVLRTKAEMYLQ